MAKWLKLTQHQYIGFFALGLAFFVLQEMPYIIMPLMPLTANPLMEMTDKSTLLNAAEKALGVSCIVALLFLVRDDGKWFSLHGTKEIVFFCVAMLAIIGYFTGWAFYFNGYQSLPLMLCTLVALPPVYYSFLGWWRGNYVLVALGGLFLIAHVSNVWNNLH
ncbi:MAG: hypothetical protein LBC26_03175 [Oscillospiraceae bacterium]|jgi:hypothetical protein|nr:hypothetical protein [Oscillospiraceae bacterium]